MDKTSAVAYSHNFSVKRTISILLL